jgi:uncharacterized protein (TIGR02646 family)
VIPVEPRPEPPDFDARVRKPAREWLAQKGLPARGPAPKDVELPPYWRACLDDLHRAYGGVCAYVSVYIEKVTGSRSVDHFIAKSTAIEDAYEWPNYRLACGIMNSRKRDFADVLDPFEIAEGTFELDLVSGKISPGAALDADQRQKAQDTIDRLGLDDRECRDLRTKYFTAYLEGYISAHYLERHCPFVWREVSRQKAFRKES